MAQLCILCKEEFKPENPSVKVGEKGLGTLIRRSKDLGLDDLYNDLMEASKQDTLNAFVHHECRRKFVDPRKKREDSAASLSRKRLRSSIENIFEWKIRCFLCNKKADNKYSTVARVETIPLIKTLLDRCESRGDEWGSTVHSRIVSCTDLVAEEAVYHISCMTSFRLHVNSGNRRGRPIEIQRTRNFERLCKWLEEEGDSELYTLSEVHSNMLEISEEGECYSMKYLKQKLVEHYGNHIFFGEQPGRPNLVCFRDMATFILRKFKSMEEQTPNDIVNAAAKIIKSDIRAMEASKVNYPSIEDIRDIDYEKQWIPESLLTFLSCLVSSKLKQVSFGQCIIQASRPRSLIAPIPFGIGIDIDKSFGTKWLVDHLAKFGFSVSADEVKLYKQSVAASGIHTTEDNEPLFTQWVADNVDHNIRTLTGKGTFHGMGIISICAKKSRSPVVKRLKYGEVKDLSSSAVKVTPYNGFSHHGLLNFTLQPIQDLNLGKSKIHEMNIDLLWHASWFFPAKQLRRPNWTGFMKHVMSKQDTLYEEASINFLPIIDLNPNDETCIFSTLLFVIEQARRQNIPTPCITFDQPLWQKATGIIKERNLNIVCRLGGFHTLMSFLGAIGNMMKGSGLVEVFAEVYSEDTVKHMFSGHAVARALRAHFLVQSALVSHIFDQLIEDEQIDMSRLESIYERATENGLTKEELLEIGNENCIHDVEKMVSSFAQKKSAESRTAKLWMQYVNYIGIIKEFIVAERTCNWSLHLQTVGKIMNLFAASGHINYAKCSRLYLQEMQGLTESNPWLKQIFEDGYHAVRRSGRLWAGLWSDLVIEQTLMRSLKTSGGLTRGRGFDENVRNLWTMSISYTAAVHNAMVTLSDVKIGSYDQNIETGSRRLQRDNDDCITFYNWFELRNPFKMDDENLHSMSSGVFSKHGSDPVNCEEAESIGARIQASLDGVNFTEAKIKRKDRFQSLDVLTRSVNVGDKDPVSVNPTLLFTRLAAIAEREEDVESYFDFELTVRPYALFKNELMRKPDKSSLRNILLTEESKVAMDDVVRKHVIDGGALLHRVSWKKGMTFKEIAEAYVHYVRGKYGNSHVVFDGYEEGSISVKSNEHARRSNSKGSSQNVNIREDNEVPYSKERFLSNSHNKSQLISLLDDFLTRDGQVVHVCKGDADTKIVSTALEVSKEFPTIVVADDTDVAIMLLYHWMKDLSEIFFLQERDKKFWSIPKAVHNIVDIKEHLLFIHAWSGCDSTSAILGKGKPSFLKLFQKSTTIQSASEIISDYWADEIDVGKAAVDVFIHQYGGTDGSSLRKMRYLKHRQMVSEGLVDPAKLPPTERAAYYHGQRVHLQVITWKMLDDSLNLQPTDWGWRIEENCLIPIPTDKDVAPSNLLKVVRCKCKTATKNQCGTNTCSCKKNGLKCMSACSGCYGEECNNSQLKDHLDLDENDENDYEDEYERNIFEDIF